MILRRNPKFGRMTLGKARSLREMETIEDFQQTVMPLGAGYVSDKGFILIPFLISYAQVYEGSSDGIERAW